MATVTPFNVSVEVAEPKTGMVQAVLNELIDQLQNFSNNAHPHVIDITSLPLTQQDKQELETLLGRGEVQITLSTIGESQIYETAYSGVWWIKHFTPDEKIISELIEINNIPEIIKSHDEDIEQAAHAIKSIR